MSGEMQELISDQGLRYYEKPIFYSKQIRSLSAVVIECLQ